MKIVTFTVTFSDGEVQTFEVEAFDDGTPKLHRAEEMTDTIKDIAGSGVVPTSIVDSNGKHYYTEWEVNIIPCPTVGKS